MGDGFGSSLILRALLLIPMILSLSVHEWAHAWSAAKLGDDTAERQGRLTLNPLAHIDLVGTIVLPLLGVPFGWAKPVPVNPARFDRKWTMRTGMALTAAAGPISNLVIAVLSAVLLGLGFRLLPEVVSQEAVSVLLGYLIRLNIMLALFNLIPVPPLDGSRVLERYVPARFQDRWQELMRFSPILLIVVFMLGGRLVAMPANALTRLLLDLVSTLGGA